MYGGCNKYDANEMLITSVIISLGDLIVMVHSFRYINVSCDGSWWRFITLTWCWRFIDTRYVRNYPIIKDIFILELVDC